MTAFQVVCMVAGSFGDSSATAGLSVTVQWLSALRLVRLPRAFSIVKACLLSNLLPLHGSIKQALSTQRQTCLPAQAGLSVSIRYGSHVEMHGLFLTRAC